eukprot:TRINITY_DN554_c1_g1_i1.p1 TRINITY_DN554_c1_g1~~TRINITY_DN554_c1_g1_i1.p1  ORF type:complete len:580 (-),score=221.91 TRINITY_DN554_c1_g1_i1:49-1788(-)
MPAQLPGVRASAPGVLAAETLPPTPDAQEGAMSAAGTDSSALASGSGHEASDSEHVPLAARMLPMVATTTVVSGAAGAVRDAVAQPEVERPAAGLMTASVGGRGSDQSAASPATAQQAAALDTDSALGDIRFHTAPSLVQKISRARDASHPFIHAIGATDSDSSDDSDSELPSASAGAAAANTAAEHQLPISELVRRCVEAPVLAQCSAIGRVACLYFTRECDLLGHVRALRRFLLCHGSAFLADFTERLHAGLVSGGGAGRCDWRRAHNLRDAFHASASAARLDEALYFNNFSYVVDTAALAAAGGGGRALLHPHAPATLSFVVPRYALPPPLRAVLTDVAAAPYVAVHAALFRNHHTALRLRALCLTLREADAATHSGGSGGSGDVWLRLRALHAFRHELQHASDCLRAHAAAQVECGWDALEARLQARGGGTSAAALGHAHGAYIHGVHARCFLGSGAVSLAVRNAIDEFHAVVCAVGRVLAAHASRAQLAAAEAAAAAGRDVGAAVLTASGSSWPVSDACFASALAERKRFERVMRQLCDALVEGALSSAADGDHAQSLLVLLGRESSDASQACR